MASRLENRKLQIAVLCTLAIVIAYNIFHYAGKKPRKRSFVYEEIGAGADLVQADDPNWATGGYKPAESWGRNPFTGAAITRVAASAGPSTSQVTAAPKPRSAYTSTAITGVIISGEERYVLAGDVLLKEGDRLGAGRIITINRNSVIVEYDTGTKTIYIE
ncbi:MAG: hypothetical protein PVJ42_02630 [bacterium]|jgi:hypothetical protein